jgi:effector-binding domain-containing protein
MDVKYKKYENLKFAYIQHNLHERSEIQSIIKKLEIEIPNEIRIGCPITFYNFIPSYSSGVDFEIGFEVSKQFTSCEIHFREIDKLEVLSLTHKGSLTELGKSYQKLFAYANKNCVISDEFCREIYKSDLAKGVVEIELQFVIHNWFEKFKVNIKHYNDFEENFDQHNVPELMDTESRKFHFVKDALIKLDKIANEDQKYEILSKCAHVFPQKAIQRAQKVYNQVYAQSENKITAIDAVLDFMITDPAWGSPKTRIDNAIFTIKNPSNKKAYDKAKTEEERRKAYCFCPLIKNHLEDEDLSDSFCYCSSGWERRQWEEILGEKVKVEVVKSLLKGDRECQFKVVVSE